MTNLLSNASFESGWRDEGNRQVPDGFHFSYAPETERNPYNGDEWNKFRAPELRILSIRDVPPSEHELFFWDGEQTVKIFGAAWKGLLGQWIVLESGHYRLTVNVFPDAVDRYEGDKKIPAPDPTSAMMRFVAASDDERGAFSAWLPMTPFLERQTRSWDFYANGRTFVGVQFLYPYAINSTAVFTDAWRLVRMDEPVTPPRGVPREDYERYYVVLPMNTTREQMHWVADDIFESKRTLGFSYDDAGVGDLSKRTAELRGIPDEVQAEYEAWYEQFYPDVNVVFTPMYGETEPEPQPDQPALGEFLTLHLQTSVPNWRDFVGWVKPAWVKVFWMEAAREVKAVSPNTKVLFRHHIEHQGPFLQNTNRLQAVNEFLSRFWEGIERNPEIDAIEGLNETIATNDIEGIRNAVEFEVALSDEVARRGGPAVVLLNTAVGNPQHGAQTEMLLPAARAAVRNNHYLGYHSYFWATPQSEGLVPWWEHHAGRALKSWDTTFLQKGFRPRYLFTEAGAVGTTDGGHNLMPGDGWKSPRCINGDWERYLGLLLLFRDMVGAWNKFNGGRAEAACLFTSGIGVGWDSFQIKSEEIDFLIDALRR